MVYLTGDTHGDFRRYNGFTERFRPTAEDVMIVLGDAGLNYSADRRDAQRKAYVNHFPVTTFCIHGNHELRPVNVPTYIEKEYRGGMVWYEPEFPKLLFAVDGEVYDFDGRSCIAIGGAYSVDKYDRLRYGYRWFADEQPSDEIKTHVEHRLWERDNRIDVVLSHTCPLRYVPAESFLSRVDQDSVDRSTEEWLDKIEARLDYRKWYCGHYHINKTVDRMQFLYGDIIPLQ